MDADATKFPETDIPFNTAASFDFLKKCFSNPDFDLSVINDDELLHSIPGLQIPINGKNLKEMIRKSVNSVSALDRNTSAFHSAASDNNLPFLQNMFKYGEPQLELKNDLGETAIFGNLR